MLRNRPSPGPTARIVGAVWLVSFVTVGAKDFEDHAAFEGLVLVRV